MILFGKKMTALKRAISTPALFTPNFIPESCMKINEKFEFYKITTDCENLSSKAKYLIGKKGDS